MNTSGKSVTRLLPLLAILAVLPFSIWSCTKAGDEPEGPTGPSSQYNPEMDTPGAKIAVSVNSPATPGIKFALSAAFTDGDGRPVQGVPLTVWAETGTGAVVEYFSIDANPNITDDQGRISTHITPSADCPNGSYRFVVSSAPGGDGPVNGPYARGYGGVYVGGVGIPAVTSVLLIPLTPSVTAPGTASFEVVPTKTPSCDLNLTFGATGVIVVPAGATADLFFDIPVPGATAAGEFFVKVTAWCTGASSEFVTSSTVPVTVE